MKDASPACPVPDGEGVSRPKDLNVHVSLLECAVTQNATLSALECALTKTRQRKSFRMRSYEKRWGGGSLPFFLFHFSIFLPSAASRGKASWVDDADAMIDEGRVHAGNSTRGMWQVTQFLDAVRHALPGWSGEGFCGREDAWQARHFA